MRVLQNHLRARTAYLKRSRLQIGTARETNLVHLESDAVLQAHALLGGFDGLPTFGSEQGNDLLSGNEGIAGGDAGPRMFSINRGSAAAEVIGRKRFESARWRNDNGRIHNFGGLISAPNEGACSGPRYADPPEPNR